MARLALHRLAAEFAHDVLRIPDQPRIVDDARAGVAREKGRRQQTDDVVALDESALLVEKEAAVEVPIEGDSQVRSGTPYSIAGDLAILLEHRVRHAVREVAVRLVIDLSEVKRQLRLEQVERNTCATVAGVRDDGKRPQLAAIHVAEQVLAPGRPDVQGLGRPTIRTCRKCAFFREQAYVLQSRVAADRSRLLAHELEAVVVGRIMARSHHDAAVKSERKRREIDALPCRTGRYPRHRRRSH